MDSGLALSCRNTSEARRYRPTRTIASGSKTRGARATLVFDAGARTVLGMPSRAPLRRRARGLGPGSTGRLVASSLGKWPAGCESLRCTTCDKTQRYPSHQSLGRNLGLSDPINPSESESRIMSEGWLIGWGVGLKSTAAVQDVPSGLSADKRWGNVVSPGTHRRQMHLHRCLSALDRVQVAGDVRPAAAAARALSPGGTSRISAVDFSPTPKNLRHSMRLPPPLSRNSR